MRKQGREREIITFISPTDIIGINSRALGHFPGGCEELDAGCTLPAQMFITNTPELSSLARSGSWQVLGSDNPQQKQCLAAEEFGTFLAGKRCHCREGVRRLLLFCCRFIPAPAAPPEPHRAPSDPGSASSGEIHSALPLFAAAFLWMCRLWLSGGTGTLSVGHLCLPLGMKSQPFST